MSDPRDPSEKKPATNEPGTPGETGTPSVPPFPSGSPSPAEPPAAPVPPTAPPTAPPVPDAAPPAAPSTPSAPPAPSAPSTPPAPSAPVYGAPPVYGSAPTPSGASAVPAPPTPPAYASAPAPGSPYGSAPSSPYGSPPAGNTPYAPGQVPPRKGNGLAITSIILGGLALITCWVPILNYLTLFVALDGLIIGLIALLRKLGSRPLSLTGTIVSGVAFLLTLALAVFYTVGFISAVNTISDYPAITSTAEPLLPGDDPSDTPSEGLPGDPTAVPGDPTPSADATVCTDGSAIAAGKAGILTYDGENQAEVSIESVELNATDQIMTENSLNETPPAGYQYALISITVKQLGTESFPAGSVNAIFKGVSEDIAADASYAVLPEPFLLFAPDLTPGASVTGNVAVFVPTSGADSGAVMLSSYSTDNTCELSFK